MIAVSDGERIRLYKGMGLVSEVFGGEQLRDLFWSLLSAMFATDQRR